MAIEIENERGESTGSTADVSRRHALRNTIAAVGLAATASRAGAGLSGVSSTIGQPSPATPQPGVHRLALHTANLTSPSFAVLQSGQSTSTAATLDGDSTGHLVSTITALLDADGVPAFLNEQQIISLPDATLIGAGIRRVGADSAVFAIIGGTGRYLGARGEYVIHGSHAANGGTGSAVYRFTIIIDDHVDTTSTPFLTPES